MQRFSARLIKTGFLNAAAATLPADLIITPERWSANDRGGCKHADLSASGSAESLAYLCGWLGDRLEIYNSVGDPVWWGVLWDLEVSLGNVTISLSMDNVYNRVAVIYPVILADGSEESATTAWVEDQTSIDRYGKRELLYGMPSSFTNAAEQVRDQLLTRFSTPGPIVNTRSDRQFGARLVGMGLWQKAASVYFTNLEGLEEHMGQSGSQVIGRYITSTGISFAGNTPGGEDDEIYINSGDFSPLVVGDRITISGAADPDNNDTYTIDTMDATNQIGIAGTFDDEVAGATVKISWGDNIAIDNVAQEFRVQGDWLCTHVAVKIRRFGTPSDAVRVGLYPDSGGIPGTVFAVNESFGNALYTELTWTEFAFAVPVLLTNGTTYYIQVRRTGPANLTDGYEVAVDEDLGYADGTLRLWNGSAWVARSPDADMPFRIIGETSSTEQIKKALVVVDDFLYPLVQVDSLIPIRQYENSERTAIEEINEMLEAGTSTGERLVVWVTFDNAVVVDVPKLSSEENLILGSDGKIRYGPGTAYAPGRLIYGQSVDVDSLLLLDGLGIRSSRGPSIYIQGSEYDAASDTLSIQSEGALDPWQALTIRKG